MKRCLFASLVFTATFGVVGVFAQLNTNTPSASELRQMIQDAERGDAVVQARLGRCYSAGRGVERDYALAVKWTRMAAEQGNPQGQNNLGAYYIKGQGVETNHVVAAEWYRKSAEQGDAWGQLSLSACYYRGQGVKKSPESLWLVFIG
jgi:TPR repeat protein